MPRRALRAGCLALFLGGALAPGQSPAGWGDVPPEVRNEVASVVAAVGSVWQDDELYVQFRQSLADRYKDTPALDAFRSTEQWLSVYSSRSVRFPGVFNARSKRDLAVKVGDIVRIRVADYRKADSYFQLTEVEAVLCKADTADFAECSARNPLSWVLRSGERVSR